MSKELAKAYEPHEVEDRIYQFWVENGYFHAEPDPKKKPYTIVIPPPNITGQLHMGHALDETLQDILIRWRRMQGYSALWLPGTDHASIATEAKIVEAMKAEGLTKEDLGREGFLKRAWEWKEKYGGTIVSQLKKLGSSCDWDRERFTLDEGCSKAVREVFVRLYQLVSTLQDLHFRCRSRVRRKGRQLLASALSAHRRFRLHSVGNHPSGNHVGRYCCGSASR